MQMKQHQDANVIVTFGEGVKLTSRQQVCHLEVVLSDQTANNEQSHCFKTAMGMRYKIYVPEDVFDLQEIEKIFR